jgi:endonuclease/exonuclease/phosphatase family metal-dependent hydrolase
MGSLDPFRPDFPLEEGKRAAFAASTPAAFAASPFYRSHGIALDRWLRAVRSGEPRNRRAERARDDRLRLVHWNIQQGKAWVPLAEALDREPRLRDADIWTLNEVDIGTARSENRNVVVEIADRLDLEWVFVANYLELTKGLGTDRLMPGENEIGLHGLAILSRWPIREAAAGEIPECHDYFRFIEEKRYGCRRLLWARIEHPSGPFVVATTHLEVRNTPDCRARQMRAALEWIPTGPAWFAGDWNTNTFRRRGRIQQAGEFLRLQRTPPDEIDRQLADPRRREPLLDLVEGAGFRLAGWNDGTPTARQVLSGVEELERFPAFLRDAVTARFRLAERTLRMRLDWIASRGPWEPLEGEYGAWTLPSVGPEGTAASDHAPIGIGAIWTRSSDLVG